MTAKVTDSGIPQLTSTAEIIVDVINTNDNYPIFDSTEYQMTVYENSPKGTVVGKVFAKDEDDGKLMIKFITTLCAFMTFCFSFFSLHCCYCFNKKFLFCFFFLLISILPSLYLFYF